MQNDAGSRAEGAPFAKLGRAAGGALTRRGALALTGGFLLGACASPPQPSPFVGSRARADHVVVYKSARSMHLLQDRKPLASYRVALGFAPDGHKQRDSDGRTPEGVYWIDRRNPRSAFFLSIGINYPNVHDVSRARAMGVNPGGNIFIHGEPNDGRYSRGTDWTAGCIAVSNAEMEEVWALVPTGTQITILA
jgi:murein L,D-transpeptidase YafK